MYRSCSTSALALLCKVYSSRLVLFFLLPFKGSCVSLYFKDDYLEIALIDTLETNRTRADLVSGKLYVVL